MNFLLGAVNTYGDVAVLATESVMVRLRAHDGAGPLR